MYTPTRFCPHRWCRSLHMMMALTAFISLGPVLFRAPWPVLAFLAIGLLVGGSVAKLAWKGKSNHDLAVEEAVPRGLGGNGSSHGLVVRAGWAATAVGLDAVFLFMGADGAWQDVQGSSYEVPSSTVEALAKLGGGLGVLWFWNFAHRKSTDPVRPRRVQVGAPVSAARH